MNYGTLSDIYFYDIDGGATINCSKTTTTIMFTSQISLTQFNNIW